MTFALLQVWGDEAAIKAMPIKQQAFLTAALLELLQQADGSGGVEGTPGLTAALLSGISARLANPIESLRCATVPQLKDRPMQVVQVQPSCCLPGKCQTVCQLRKLGIHFDYSHCLQGPEGLTWPTRLGLSDAC